MQPDELKALRKAAGMTQADFADAIGMSRKAVNEMEAGKAPIERRTEIAARVLLADRQPSDDNLVRASALACADRMRTLLDEGTAVIHLSREEAVLMHGLLEGLAEHIAGIEARR